MIKDRFDIWRNNNFLSVQCIPVHGFDTKMSQLFFGTAFLKVFVKIHRKTHDMASFYGKFTELACNFTKKKNHRRRFLVDFAKFFRTHFWQNTSGWLFLKWTSKCRINKNKLNNLPGSLFCLCMIFNLLYNWRYDCLRNTTPKQDAHSKFSPNEVPTWLFKNIIHYIYKKLVCKKLELRWQTN